MSQPHPFDPQKGDAYTYTTATGEPRRYVVESTHGYAVHFTCLDPPHAPVKGYRGGDSREARIRLESLLREPWTPGHAEQLPHAA